MSRSYQSFKQAVINAVEADEIGTFKINDDVITETFYCNYVTSIVVPFNIPFSDYSDIAIEDAELYCHGDQISIPFKYVSADEGFTKFEANLKDYYQSIN